LVTPKKLRIWSKNLSNSLGLTGCYQYIYIHHKPFTVKFPDKHEWQNGFNADNKVGLVWYTYGSKTNKGTDAGVYGWGLRRGHSFILVFHTTVLQIEIYTIEAYIMENTEKRYTWRIQINSNLVWDCHQSLVKLAENNRIQLVWVPGHTGIDGDERAVELVRQGSSHAVIGPEPMLLISAKVAREVIREWTSRKHREHWQLIHGQKQAKGFL
jgi:hypothetical protein